MLFLAELIGFAFAVVKTKSWKSFGVGLALYTVIAGFMGHVPRQDILNETIRNLYFHVPMWFGMIIMMFVSVIYSIKYLRKGELQHDNVANSFVETATIFGLLGLSTGMIWANYTWGHFFPAKEVKLKFAAIALLVYFAYLILRGALPDDIKKARISAIYNIFAFPAMITLLYILPRMFKDSLHPGAEGNPAFSDMDLDNTMRVVFYPAIIAWTLMGVWVASLKIRIRNVQIRLWD